MGGCQSAVGRSAAHGPWPRAPRAQRCPPPGPALAGALAPECPRRDLARARRRSLRSARAPGPASSAQRERSRSRRARSRPQAWGLRSRPSAVRASLTARRDPSRTRLQQLRSRSTRVAGGQPVRQPARPPARLGRHRAPCARQCARPLQSYLGRCARLARTPHAPASRDARHVRIGRLRCAGAWALPCRYYGGGESVGVEFTRCSAPGRRQARDNPRPARRLRSGSWALALCPAACASGRTAAAGPLPRCTAASLGHGHGHDGRRSVLLYD